MPKWAAQLVQHQSPNIVERTARRTAVWTAINGLHTAAGPTLEFTQAQARVAGGTAVPHTTPTHVPGTDPVRSRAEVERELAASPV